jgi:hypothetical protein
VLPQRRGVAVVEVHPERLGVELVDELLPGTDELERPVHVRRVDAVEVDGVRVRPLVLERDAHQIPLPGPQGWSRHLTVERPGRVKHPRRHLDLGVLSYELVLADGPAALLALLPPVEVPQELRGVEPGKVHVSLSSVLPHHPLVPPGIQLLPVGRPGMDTRCDTRDPQGPRGPQA